MRISDWSSDVCSSDLHPGCSAHRARGSGSWRRRSAGAKAPHGAPGLSPMTGRQWVAPALPVALRLFGLAVVAAQVLTDMADALPAQRIVIGIEHHRAEQLRHPLRKNGRANV